MPLIYTVNYVSIKIRYLQVQNVCVCVFAIYIISLCTAMVNLPVYGIFYIYIFVWVVCVCVWGGRYVDQRRTFGGSLSLPTM